MIFTIENLNIQGSIWSYLQSLLVKKTCISTLARWIVNEFDSSPFELRVFESAF